LIVYKRILSLLTQSSDLLVNPSTYLPDIDTRAIETLNSSLAQALTAQLVALPEGVFDTELPELDAYFMDELENLRVNISAASSHWAGPVRQTVDIAWKDLQSKCKARWGWTIDGLSEARPQSDEESDEEEGEYAPVIVDM
jgi:A1 cistron-splicing factor AAR2